MRKSRFTEAQIVAIVRESEREDVTVGRVAKKHGSTETTLRTRPVVVVSHQKVASPLAFYTPREGSPKWKEEAAKDIVRLMTGASRDVGHRCDAVALGQAMADYGCVRR